MQTGTPEQNSALQSAHEGVTRLALLRLVVLLVVDGDGSPAGIGLLRPGGRPAHDGLSAVGREVLVEHDAVPVSAIVISWVIMLNGGGQGLRLLGVWDVAAPFWLGVLHHLVGDVQLGVVLQGIDPSVPDAIAELLLLSVEDVLWQVGLCAGLVRDVEGLSEDVLLDAVLGDHLILRIDVHGYF